MICSRLNLAKCFINTCARRFSTQEKIQNDLYHSQWWEGSIRNHPGRASLPPVSLPKEFIQSARLYMKNCDSKTIALLAEKLTRILFSRRVMISERAVRIPVFQPKKIKKENNIDLDDGFDEVMKEESNYKWKQMVYDDYLAPAFLIGRSSACFASCLKVLSEIKKNNPEFLPNSLLDFGSGVGTTVWAANQLWGLNLKQYICVDSSAAMNNLANFLFCGGDETKNLPGIFFRQFLPVTVTEQYDIVVASYSLSELPTERDRLALLKILWQKTQRYLVIIENGNYYGHYIILEARNLLNKGLQGGDRKKANVWTDFKTPASIIVPCPHNNECPMTTRSQSCVFEQKYNQLSLLGNNENHKTEKFSYIVFDKKQQEVSQSWPRLTTNPVKSNKTIYCQVCNADGCIKNIAVKKQKHGHDVYKTVGLSKMGDRIPFQDLD